MKREIGRRSRNFVSLNKLLTFLYYGRILLAYVNILRNLRYRLFLMQKSLILSMGISPTPGFELSRSRIVTQILFFSTQVSPCLLKIAIHFKTSNFKALFHSTFLTF